MSDSLQPDRPLRALHLCAVDFTVRHFMLPMIDRLGRAGIDTRVGCAPGPYTGGLRQDGYRMENLPIVRGAAPLRHLLSLWRITRYLRRERIDILHVHTPIAALIGRTAAFLARTPLVFYTAHGFYFHDQMAPLRRRFHIGLEKVGAAMCDFIFTCSDEDRQSAIALGIACPGKVKTILNGIDLERFSRERFGPGDRERIRADLGIAPDALVVAISGRLVREKGYFEFLEAAAACRRRFPAARFLALGDALDSDHDSARDAFRERIAALGLGEALVPAGMRTDMPEMLLAADVFTLPSYREGMPYSILEAMAMGLPVVATDIRGCREEVVDGETGFLVPARDSAALGDKIARLLGDGDLRRTLGAAGRRRVEALFEESMTVEKQWVEYERLMGEKGLRPGRVGAG